ncbi:MAG: hypothetical protein J6Y99_05890 [Bacteroidales bacterium]|nr:hypothetical protein [Bacteroidales bacterium]
MFNLFISESALRAIVQTEEQKPKADQSYLYKIIRLLPKLYVSAESADIAWSRNFPTGHPLPLDFSCSDYIRAIPTHPASVLQHPSSLFILDISALEAQAIQKSYGVLCMSSQQAHAASLLDVNDEHTTGNGEPFDKGWGTVLKSVHDLPSNALLLTDRYLFARTSPRLGDGLANVQSILNELLPLQFAAEYHVTIVFDKESLHPSYTFEDLATRLNRLKQNLHRDYPIHMEVLGITPDCEIYNKLHNRRIVSNYYIVKVEHKLAAFNGNKGTALQTITPQLLFTADSLNGSSSPPLKSIDYIHAALRQFSRDLAELRDHSIYRYALNGKHLDKCDGIINRILK